MPVATATRSCLFWCQRNTSASDFSTKHTSILVVNSHWASSPDSAYRLLVSVVEISSSVLVVAFLELDVLVAVCWETWVVQNSAALEEEVLTMRVTAKAINEAAVALNAALVLLVEEGEEVAEEAFCRMAFLVVAVVQGEWFFVMAV